ncbi:PAS domain S-box-containing protein [Marinospirillum celere]|uniref:PAS domain S-box-containing protein n=1 Tax=Marinospirillum celere TaxID=1122252 RepID=A0A1I1FLY6_9GAMM|nr:response regulator [Marinospirillum celere]SFC00344.1 PAS domain S-box-containing protein [Marinospirillum celere]
MSLFQQSSEAEHPDGLKALSVLYVEDNEDVRAQLLQFLERRFGQVLLAKDGAEGLHLYTRQNPRPDLVISDIRMPKMDGLAMAEHLREMNPDQPIIMTTAHEETEYLLRAIDLGVDKFILKPVNTRQLNQTLLRLANQLHARKELDKARKALQESEERYRTLFWTAMDAFCIFDWDSLEIQEINRQHQVLFGYSYRELQGCSLVELFADQQFAKVRDLIDQTERQREVFLVNVQNSSEEIFPAEMLVARFKSGHRDLGLMTSRDASDRLASMKEQEALVEVLEMTIEALGELTRPSESES